MYENCIFPKKTLWLLLPPSGVSAVLCKGFQFLMSDTKCIIYSQAWYNYLLMFELDMWMQHGGFHSTWNNYFVITIRFFQNLEVGKWNIAEKDKVWDSTFTQKHAYTYTQMQRDLLFQEVRWTGDVKHSVPFWHVFPSPSIRQEQQAVGPHTLILSHTHPHPVFHEGKKGHRRISV